MSALRRTPIYRALHRPNLFLGGERELVLITAIACAGVGVSSLTVFGAVASLLVWSLCIGLFRLMAKSDPQLSRVYLRQLRHQPYYPARSLRGVKG
jgi:type IV secretion system protein VirB3